MAICHSDCTVKLIYQNTAVPAVAAAASAACDADAVVGLTGIVELAPVAFASFQHLNVEGARVEDQKRLC